MADYPLFLGIAVYIALVGLQRDFFNIRPLDILRWSASITLMWAALEKWAYPEWTYALFGQHPGLTAGFSPDFFMRAAGWVEFSLAFSLLWTPLVRRVGAILLTGMFVGAVFDFGKIDFIGHSLIIVALLAIFSDSSRTSRVSRFAWLLPGSFSGALCAVGAAYYGVHALIYGTTIFNGPTPESVRTAMAMQDKTHAHLKPQLSTCTKNGNIFVKWTKTHGPIPYHKHLTSAFAIFDKNNASKHLKTPQMPLFIGMRDSIPHAFAYGMQSSPKLVRKNNITLDVDSMFFYAPGMDPQGDHERP
jgi:hypothetical protein